MRALLYEFQTYDELATQLEAGGDEQDLELRDPEGLRDGEWVLVTFLVEDACTAIAGCVTDRGDGLRLAFTERDWGRLWAFANCDGPPTIPPSRPVPSARVFAPPGTHVLVVDDDVNVQGVVCTLLENAGFQVTSKGSAEDAYDFLRARPVNLVVLDWNLPGMSGIDLTRRLRADPERARLPILFLTSHSSADDLVQAFAAGADDFVSKPFRAPELGARVMGLLRRVASA